MSNISDKEKKIKTQILADKLMNVLPILDSFMESLTDEDFELLKEARESLSGKISYNNSAQAIIGACGGYYDDKEDKMKLKTLDLIIDYLNTRKEYREYLIENQKQKENKKELLKLFGIIGT